MGFFTWSPKYMAVQSKISRVKTEILFFSRGVFWSYVARYIPSHPIKIIFTVKDHRVREFSLLAIVDNISVYLYKPSNTTKEMTLSCLRLHVSTSGSHHQAFLRA
jgi:hypothetical protein